MRLYFDRHGQYRGFSTGVLFWIAAGAVILVLALALGYQLFMLAPFLAVPALAIVLWRSEIRRWRARRAERTGSEQAQQH